MILALTSRRKLGFVNGKFNKPENVVESEEFEAWVNFLLLKISYLFFSSKNVLGQNEKDGNIVKRGLYIKNGKV